MLIDFDQVVKMPLTQKTKSFSGLHLARHLDYAKGSAIDKRNGRLIFVSWNIKHLNILCRTHGLLHSHSCKDAGHPVPPIFISELQMR